MEQAARVARIAPLNNGSSAVDPIRLHWPTVLFAWSVPALLATIPYWVRGNLTRQWPFLAIEVARWLTWIALTPLVFALVERYPLRRETLRRTGWLHLAAAVVVAFAVESLWYVISRGVRAYFEPPTAVRVTIPGVRRATPSELFASGVLARVAGSVMTYAAATGVAATINYYRRFREREVRAAQLETQLATAHVQALKMQLHPHFLFNTLHAVNVLIPRDPVAATRMVTSLGDLLRTTLARASSAEVPLSDELQLLTLYFEIERTRFQDRLTIEYDIDPAIQSALVPDLILQPIAENAIRHGVATLSGAARVVVRAHARDSVLTLEIADNGVGLEREDKRRSGIGLTSTRERLRRLYGSGQSLELLSPPSGGCIVRINLPHRDAHGVPVQRNA